MSEWNWSDVREPIEKLLREKYGVGLESVTVVRTARSNWHAHVPAGLTFVPTRYRNVDRKGVRAWLWRFFGKVLGKPRWGQDKVMLEPMCPHEVEEIQLSQYTAKDPCGVEYRWWMGYGPESKVLAIGDWEGSTGFAQSRKGERDADDGASAQDREGV